MIKAIFFDIDGTLLSHNTGQITAVTRNVLRKLQERNVKCVAATGRHLLEIAELPARDIAFDGYITLNGQLCLDREKKIVYKNPITGEDKAYLLKLFRAKEVPVMFIEENRMYINFVNEYVREVQADISTEVPEVDEYFGAEVYQVVVYIEKNEQQELEARLSDSKITRWNPKAIDILPAKGGKVAGIQQYLWKNGIEREETMAFGDGENDAEMLQFAQIGVAMGNAGISAKANADYVTASVEEEGVAKAIQYFEKQFTKAIIFDLDGLLIDSEIIAYKVYQQLLEPFGFALSIHEYAEKYSGKILVENVANTIEQYGLPWELSVGVEKVLELEAKLLGEGVDLKPGAKELLAYLRRNHYKIALGSSSRAGRALKILERHQILSFFDEIVFGVEVERGKPYPDIFLKACEKLKVKPEECLVLEDSEAGIQAAYSAKIPVICVPDMKKPRQEFEEMTATVCDSLYDVMTYLKMN